MVPYTTYTTYMTYKTHTTHTTYKTNNQWPVPNAGQSPLANF